MLVSEETDTFQTISAYHHGEGADHSIEWSFLDADDKPVYPSRYKMTMWADNTLRLCFYGDNGHVLFVYKWRITKTDVAYKISNLIKSITPTDDPENLNHLVQIWALFSKHRIPFKRVNAIKLTRAGNNPPVVRRFVTGDYVSVLPVHSCTRVFDHHYV